MSLQQTARAWRPAKLKVIAAPVAAKFGAGVILPMEK